jgi:cyclohexanecarboxyl-CoA dehydrogenase
VDIQFTDEQRMLQKLVRDYALERLLPRARRWLSERWPRELALELGELGVLGLRVPEEFGGSKATFVDMGIASEELCRGDINVSPLFYLATIAAGILQLADAEIQQEYLPGIASGGKFVCFGLTEPGIGSDAAHLITTARRDGSDFLINGEKASITMTGLADACIVFARSGSDGSGGISMFFVPLDSPGVTRQVYQVQGRQMTERGSLFFSDVRIPERYQIGTEGAGFKQAMEAFDFNRALISLACIGAALQSLDETVEYAKLRKTMGKPLAKHQAIATKIAEHISLVHAARLVAYETLTLADAGRPHTTEAAMAKLLGPRASVDAIHACLLVHGWAGYGSELPFQQRLNDVMGSEIGDGTAEIMQLIIARETFGREFGAFR